MDNPVACRDVRTDDLGHVGLGVSGTPLENVTIHADGTCRHAIRHGDQIITHQVFGRDNFIDHSMIEEN